MVSPYIHSLYLLVHERRHNEPNDPGHASCNAWTGQPGIPAGMDERFEPGSGYARAARYLMWVYKFGLADPTLIKNQAKIVVPAFKDRLCNRPTSTNPTVQALITGTGLV